MYWRKSIYMLFVVPVFIMTLILASGLVPPVITRGVCETKPALVSDGTFMQTANVDHRTWTVKNDGPADFHTIQEAINAANAGDIISVGSGTYRENVVVNKTVSVIGEDKWTTIIDGNNQEATVQIISDNAQISSFTIINGSASNVLIGAGGVVVRDNLISNGSTWGIAISMGCSNNRVEGNIIRFHSDYGIVLIASSYNVIVGNTVEDNYGGIDCTNHKDMAGDLLVPSHDNSIYHNNIIRNVVQARSESQWDSQNIWDDGVSGNYWSDYDGTDLDHDGIGDTPYVINALNADNHPLMGMFQSFITSLGKEVSVISNFTVEDFAYFESNNIIMMRVSNTTANQTYGFCRLTIPHDAMSPPYNVSINNNPTNYTMVFENDTLNTIYLVYALSTLEIGMASEFPPLTILSVFMMGTLLTITVCKRKHSA